MEHTLPEVQSLNDQATALQNRITLLSAEQVRLLTLNTSELYTVSQLNIQKKDLEEVIGGLTDIKNVLEVDVNNLTAKKYLTETSIDEKAKSLDSREAEISAKEVVLNDLEDSVKIAGEELAITKTNLAQDRISFDEERKQFAEKVAQVKAVVNF
jgi:chromosome segregation ATPase